MALAKHSKTIRRTRKFERVREATSSGKTEAIRDGGAPSGAEAPKAIKVPILKFASTDIKALRTLKPSKVFASVPFPDFKKPPTLAEVPESRHEELTRWCRDASKYWAELKYLGVSPAGSVLRECKPWDQFLQFFNDYLLEDMRTGGPLIVLPQTDKVGKIMVQLVFLVLFRQGYFSEHDKGWWAMESGSARFMRAQEHADWVKQQKNEDKALFPDYDPRFDDTTSLFDAKAMTRTLAKLMIVSKNDRLFTDDGDISPPEDIATPRPSRTVTPAPESVAGPSNSGRG